MDDKPKSRSPRADNEYHHGDLRRSLMQAALQLVEKKGLQDFTLREAARVANVSHNAPYRHFSSRAQLLVELAIAGQRKLREQLQKETEAAANPRERVLALGTAYMEFAITNTAYFLVMFSNDVVQNRTEELEAVQDATFDFLVEELQAGEQAGLLRPGAVERHTLAGWSLLHGTAMLVLDGHFADSEIAAHRKPRELARLVLETLLDGMHEGPK